LDCGFGSNAEMSRFSSLQSWVCLGEINAIQGIDMYQLVHKQRILHDHLQPGDENDDCIIKKNKNQVNPITLEVQNFSLNVEKYCNMRREISYPQAVV